MVRCVKCSKSKEGIVQNTKCSKSKEGIVQNTIKGLSKTFYFFYSHFNFLSYLYNFSEVGVKNKIVFIDKKFPARSLNQNERKNWYSKIACDSRVRNMTGVKRFEFLFSLF